MKPTSMGQPAGGQPVGGNENGYVLVTALLFMVVLSVIGIASNHTSNIEMQIAGNERAVNEDLFMTDGQLNNALEDTGDWLADDSFLMQAVTEAGYSKNDIDVNGDGESDFTVEVRCIEPTATKIDTLSDYANNIPKYDHTGPPPPNFDYSVVNFYVRRFAVTARSADNRTILQTGVWKAFPIGQTD